MQITDVMKNTPLVELPGITERGTVYAKCEYLLPGGSIKDRAALKIIDLAREKGDLKDGQTVVEMTSGNMGAGLAVVCDNYHHKFVAVMPVGNSRQRVDLLKALGAQVELVPQVDGVAGMVTGKDIEAAAQRARDLARELKGYYVDQFNNPGNVLAHYETTGPEIWEQTRGEMDAFACCVGSSGTFTGIAGYLKEREKNIQCYVIEPAGCEVLAGKQITKKQHIIQGAGYGIVPPKFDARLADGYFAVTDREVVEMKTLLGRRYGIFIGYSAAANVCGSIKIAGHPGTGNSNIVTLLSDTGFKYGI